MNKVRERDPKRYKKKMLMIKRERERERKGSKREGLRA